MISILEKIVEPETAGDPMSEKKWLRRSLRQLSAALAEEQEPVSYVTVRRLLKDRHYALHSNRKRLGGSPHPDRDRQFRYIERVRKLFTAAGHPVISVDAKKKELIGNFKNPGRTWSRQAEAVNVYDFPQNAVGRAVPYGIYDLLHNLGYVYVGTSAETATLAVDAIVHWWQLPDRPPFADEGGAANFSRWRRQ